MTDHSKSNSSSSLSTAKIAAAAVLSSGGSESLGWLNDILKQLWPNMCAVGETIIKESVEPVLAEGLPQLLRGLKFTTIDFGSAPPAFDNIDVFTTQNSIIKLNIDVSWEAKDCKITLEDRIISAGVAGITLKGRLSVLMGPLINTLPLVGAVQLAFINPPTIDIDFTGIANIADWSIVDTKIQEIVQSQLAPMMVLPNRLLSTLDPTNNFCRDTYQEPVGIVRVTIVKGSQFRDELGLFRKDIPDLYVKTKFGALTEEWTTSVQKNTKNPAWNEQKDFIFSDDDQELRLEVWDADNKLLGDPDDLIGVASTTMGQFLLNDTNNGLDSLKLSMDGSHIGPEITIQAEIYKCVPDLASFTLPDFSNGNDRSNCICGYLIILVGQVFDIAVPKIYANTSVKVGWGSKYDFVTPSVVNAPGMDPTNPSFNTPFLIPLTQEDVVSTQSPIPDVVFTMMNNDDKIGTLNVSFDDIANDTTKTMTGDKVPFISADDNSCETTIQYRVSLRGLSK
mmetsp:Transcript_21744/g.24164  ORF Transcript_21744/g.24164 Transcript_21744/m.24164 type:complete len:508 (-) Transcript_21744:169-1692(-)